jgi:ABC-type sulfate/molybdate transport systems ATPase subunit
LVAGHSSIAYLSQNFELQKFLRVEQVFSYANILSEDDANKLMEVCQIDHLVKRKTDQLSGGERQRIALATLLVKSPKLLLLDEPFTHLDMPHKSVLKEVIDDISNKLGITCVLVSHDPNDTLSWADKILVLKDGKVIQKGSPQEIYSAPVNEYVAGLFGKYNLIHWTDTKLLKSMRLKPVRGKSYFLRPEQIIVAKKGNPENAASVIESKFYGNRFEIVANASGKNLCVVSEQPIKTGRRIFLDRRAGKSSLIKTPKLAR